MLAGTPLNNPLNSTGGKKISIDEKRETGRIATVYLSELHSSRQVAVFERFKADSSPFALKLTLVIEVLVTSETHIFVSCYADSIHRQRLWIRLRWR